MSIYTIADLHLPGAEGKAKSMEVFGSRWADSLERLKKNWCTIVSESDSVIIPGDITWAMNLKEAENDFKFIDSLPGKKYIGKGNHDFWWTTSSKMNAFFQDNKFNTLNILYNNAYLIENTIICGSRGWFFDEISQNTVGDVSWEKITNREAIRLKMSLECAKKILDSSDENNEIIAFLHFPPVWNNSVARNIVNLLHDYNVIKCYFGHIHSEYVKCSSFSFESINFELISSDRLSFVPRLVNKSVKK